MARLPVYFRLMIVCAIVMATRINAQNTIAVQQEVIPVTYIFDKEIITSVIESNLIPANPDSVTKIRFIDITRNGFGDNDLLTLYPSELTYPFIVDTLLSNVMQSWRFNTGSQLVTQNRPPEFFEQLHSGNSFSDAENWILAGMLRRLNQCYSGVPIKLYFARDSTGTVRLDLWGLDTSAAALHMPDVVQQVVNTAPDTVFVVRRDTIFVVKQE